MAAENQKKKRGRPPKDKEKVEEHASTAKENSEKFSDLESDNEVWNWPQKKKTEECKGQSESFQSFHSLLSLLIFFL